MPRRNSIVDAMASFNSTYNTVRNVVLDAKLAKIGRSEVEKTDGWTDDQLKTMTDAKDENGKAFYNVQRDDNGGVTVTPNFTADGTDGTAAPVTMNKEKYQFLGKTYDKAPNESEQLSARNQAMAGVLKSMGDPIKGIAMEMQARQGAREETRFRKEQDYEKEFGQAVQGTRFGQNQQQYNKALGEYQQKMSEYEGAKASGKTGPQLGLPPSVPARPDYTIGDQLADRASMLAVDAKYGKLDARKFGELSDSLTKLQNEGYESALRLAQSGAKLDDVLAQFNKTGSTKFDASSVISDKMTKGEGGINTRVITYRDANDNVRSLNTLSELDSLGKANEAYNRFFNVQQNNRANASEGRSAYNFNEARTEKQDKRDAAVNLYTETNPNASQAQINAVRNGVIDPVPKNNDGVTVDFKQDGYGGNVIQKMRDGTVTIIPVKAPVNGQPVVIPGPRAKQPAATQEAAQPSTLKPIQDATQAEIESAMKKLDISEAAIEATAKKYNMSKEQVRKQLGLK